jgi:hypothetical protein
MALRGWKPRILGLLVLGSASFSATHAAPPVNDTCSNSIRIYEGYTPFSTALANTDGAPNSLCHVANSSQIRHDIWFHYIAYTKSLTVGLCESNFDTRVAIYARTDCPPEPSDILGCNDDGCGDQSVLKVETIPGQCYLIRVGGYFNSVGSGFILIESGCTGCGCQIQEDCCTAHLEPFCNNPECCSSVCLIDPHCCDVSWDDYCVAIAEHECANFCTNSHPGDVNSDGACNTDDLLAVINEWGPCGKCSTCDADLNDDGTVDADDLLAVIEHWT